MPAPAATRRAAAAPVRRGPLQSRFRLLSFRGQVRLMRTVALLAGAALVALFLSMAATADFLKRNRDSRLGRCVDEAVAACGASACDAALAGAPAGSTFRPAPILNLDPEAPLPED